MTPSENTGREASDPVAMLRVVKIVHTIAWALFVGCSIAIPVAAWRGHIAAAGWLSGIVLLEVIVLVFNRWRCPLTAVAGRYTEHRRNNFDTYLPESLARYDKVIFGTLYILGVAYAVGRWVHVTR